MATTIITKHSATAKDPAPNQLERGELAIDLERKNIYTKDASDEVVQLGGRPVKIGATAPPTPQEGDLWMEVPTAMDAPAMMWVYDGDKWLEHPSGVDGAPGADGADGNIADGASDGSQDGVVATWNSTAGQWTPDSSLTIDATGDATFAKHIHYNWGYGNGVISEDDTSLSALYGGSSGQTGGGVVAYGKDYAGYAGREGGISFFTDNFTEQLRIDSTGNATFSSEVRSNISGGAVRINPTDQGATSPHMRFWGNTGGSWYNVGRSTSDGKFHINVGANFDSPANDALTIDPSGNVGINNDSPSMPLDVHYGGYVDGAKNTIARFTATNDMSRGIEFSSYTQNTGYGGRFDINVKGTGSQNRLSFSQMDVISLEFNTQQDATFAGRIFKNGGTQEVLSTRDLIETLSTLRNATKDETTLEGLRDAIGNAVGGLIEKFEAMQDSAVTQDIQESPVTQEITNED